MSGAPCRLHKPAQSDLVRAVCVQRRRLSVPALCKWAAFLFRCHACSLANNQACLPQPIGSKLTEDCFHKAPMPFAGDSKLMMSNGKMLNLTSVFVSEGTVPAGSTWQMMPM